MYEGGLAWMRHSISDTAEYGDYTRGPRVVNSQTKDEMRKILKEIQSGQFAKEFILENQVGGPMFEKYRETEAAHPIEEVGQAPPRHDELDPRGQEGFVGSERPVITGFRTQGRPDEAAPA